MFRQITRVIGETLPLTPKIFLSTRRFVTTNDGPQNKNGSWECIENHDGSLTIYNPNIRKTVRISSECAENGCVCNGKVFIFKELTNDKHKKFPTRESEVTISC